MSILIYAGEVGFAAREPASEAQRDLHRAQVIRLLVDQ